MYTLELKLISPHFVPSSGGVIYRAVWRYLVTGGVVADPSKKMHPSCLCVQRVVYILKVQLRQSCFRNYNGQYLWVTLVAQYKVTSVYFIAVYHECVLRKGSKNTPNFDCNVV